MSAREANLGWQRKSIIIFRALHKNTAKKIGKIQREENEKKNEK
jgi:hypothetical protein